VEGEALAARLRRGALKLEEAVAVAKIARCAGR